MIKFLVKIALFTEVLPTIVPSSFTKSLSPCEGESGDFQSKVRAHIYACLAFTELKKMRTGILKKKKGRKKNDVGSHKTTSKGRKTEQLHLVHDTMASWWKPVYSISFLHYPPLCFLISANPSIQGFCVFHFLSAICFKSPLCIFYPLPHLNFDHFLLWLKSYSRNISAITEKQGKMLLLQVFCSSKHLPANCSFLDWLANLNAMPKFILLLHRPWIGEHLRCFLTMFYINTFSA